MVRSVVGYPKDLIAVKLLGAPFVVGQEALEKRSFLDLRYPVEDGVLREYSARDLEVARHLIAHMIEVADTGPNDEICAIIGAPARASATNKALLLKVAQETMDMALVVSEPFMVAYGQGKLLNSIVVDIGAGTVDICSLKGSLPGPEGPGDADQGGEFRRRKASAMILEEYPNVQMNTHVAAP